MRFLLEVHLISKWKVKQLNVVKSLYGEYRSSSFLVGKVHDLAKNTDSQLRELCQVGGRELIMVY